MLFRYSKLERCQSGRMGRPAKALFGFIRTVGSNPTLSARLLKFALVLSLVGGLVSISPDPLSACSVRHMTKSGDSWWSIAEKYNLDINQVLRINNATASSMVLIGQPVCVGVRTKKSIPKTENTSKSNVVQIIRDEWPDDLEERAILIARRESKLNPRAIGIPKQCCFGLFQIFYRWHRNWLPSVGVTRTEDLLDPRLNARAAFRLYQRNNGWSAWK